MNKCQYIILSSLFLSASLVYADIDRVSVSSADMQANGESNYPSFSADGRFVTFVSNASNLVDSDTNGKYDVFLRDRISGVTERVSVSSAGLQGNGSSSFNEPTAISADGRFIVFKSSATNLISNDTNVSDDIFIHDRLTKSTERVSVSTGGNQANKGSRSPAISADSRFIAFTSTASNLVDDDSNERDDVFVHDRIANVTKRVSVSSTGVQGTNISRNPVLSADGRYVAFNSAASNLVDNDTNGVSDTFVHDRNLGITERVSVSSTGVQGNKNSYYPSLSADGRFVAYATEATNLLDGKITRGSEVFVYDRSTGINELAHVSSESIQGNGNVGFQISLSADGRFLAFLSTSTNLDDGDKNNRGDIFVHDRDTGVTQRANLSAQGFGALGGISLGATLSANGRFVAYHTKSSNLVDTDTNVVTDVFVNDNSLFYISDDLSVTVEPSSGATQVGEYIRFRASFKNGSGQQLINCKAQIVNPIVNGRREFSFYSWPLNVSNPVLNGSINIAPGATGNMNLAVLPRVAMRQEVHIKYLCDNAQAFTIPFINTVHLTAKTEPLIAEDFVQLANGNNKTQLLIDRSNGKYWTPYVVNVINTGVMQTNVNLSSRKDNQTVPFRAQKLCEPLDPGNGNWSCSSPRNGNIQVLLDAGEIKKVLVFLHADLPLENLPIVNRITVEASDQAGEIVAKKSISVYSIN